MTNREYIINLLLDGLDKELERFTFDDAGASEESMINYNINCPYFSGDERALCDGRENDICRELCVECKSKWLDNEVDT